MMENCSPSAHDKNLECGEICSQGWPFRLSTFTHVVRVRTMRNYNPSARISVVSGVLEASLGGLVPPFIIHVKRVATAAFKIMLQQGYNILCGNSRIEKVHVLGFRTNTRLKL